VLDSQVERILAVIRPHGILQTRIAVTAQESEAIWQVRRIVSPSLRKVAPDKFNEDIVVPRSRVPDMIHALERISVQHGVPIVNFGHAGDGNIHVNIMVDLKIDGMPEKVERILDEVFSTVIELKGSISGEHGIGTSKARFLSRELDPLTISCMRRIKAALDPNNVLNPGKIFGDLVPAPQEEPMATKP